MLPNDSSQLTATKAEPNHQGPVVRSDERQASARCKYPALLSEPKDLPSVTVFNPFAEAYIANGRAFTPTKEQVMLAQDLCNLPQFCCGPNDIVVVTRRPSADFLNSLKSAGFPGPEFVQLDEGRLARTNELSPGGLRALKPWAWAPDSLDLFKTLFEHLPDNTRTPEVCFNERIAQFYSKTWSASFLRKVIRRLAGCGKEASGRESKGQETSRERFGFEMCSEDEAGLAVGSLDEALDAIGAIRKRGHHKVVVKEPFGLAGKNAIRLWEPEISTIQIRWMSKGLEKNGSLLVEPWLNREFDFSVQMEMDLDDLKICGYTGLINDFKGQFIGNWVDPDYSIRLPHMVGARLGTKTTPACIETLFSQILSILKVELRSVGFAGPISIDAFTYRTDTGECRLKPIVEINPRYTMGRLLLELMKHAVNGSYGVFRIVSRAQARKEGFRDLLSYSKNLSHRMPLISEVHQVPKIRSGAICLNEPEKAEAVLAIFEVHARPVF